MMKQQHSASMSQAVATWRQWYASRDAVAAPQWVETQWAETQAPEGSIERQPHDVEPKHNPESSR